MRDTHTSLSKTRNSQKCLPLKASIWFLLLTINLRRSKQNFLIIYTRKKKRRWFVKRKHMTNDSDLRHLFQRNQTCARLQQRLRSEAVQMIPSLVCHCFRVRIKHISNNISLILHCLLSINMGRVSFLKMKLFRLGVHKGRWTEDNDRCQRTRQCLRNLVEDQCQQQPARRNVQT